MLVGIQYEYRIVNKYTANSQNIIYFFFSFENLRRLKPQFTCAWVLNTSFQLKLKVVLDVCNFVTFLAHLLIGITIFNNSVPAS